MKFKDLLLVSEQRKYPLIVAELGAKFRDLETLKRSIDIALGCGVDFVKFQTYSAKNIATPGSCFEQNDGKRISQYDYFLKYELTAEDHFELISYCEQKDINWFSTPSHQDDIDLLEKYNPVCYKSGSDDLTNLPFLHYLARQMRPMVVSTGMCTLGEIERAIEVITQAGNTQIILMHCVVSYPSLVEDANLKVIETLQKAFGFPVGLSDHTQDELTSILATQLGVVMIEKHFTIDHDLEFPDHDASLDKSEFTRLVDKVSSVSLALGSGEKKILETEKKWRQIARKSIFTARDIKKGSPIVEEDLIIRRPGDGIHPHHYEFILGKVAKQDISKDQVVTWDIIQS
ncbi:MAG: N-acetylneuraminate synthase family protein [Gammaproteobacteria bacterium]|jgi:N,N'-diacetyllegionaminate synthase